MILTPADQCLTTRAPPGRIYPTDDESAQRAYELIVSRTAGRGSLVNYRKIAEDELLERAAARAIGPVQARERRRKDD